MEDTRADRWLWAVRVYPTRSISADACRGGHVTINDQPAKAASPVRVGDRIRATTPGSTRLLEVVLVIDKRVGAAVAAGCFIDHSPPVVRDPDAAMTPFLRQAGAGRPTKRDRRQMDRFRSS